MARPVYQYRPIADNKDTALGILLPLNKGAVGKSASSNYASGSSGGNGVFESSYTTFEAAVSNLKNLILTEKGERYMQPNLGTNIRSILFENNTSTIREILKSEIENDISFWLPYISLQAVDVSPSADQQSLTVRLLFEITNIGANVVINILAAENTFTVTEETTDQMVEVGSFGADTAFSLGGGGTY